MCKMMNSLQQREAGCAGWSRDGSLVSVQLTYITHPRLSNGAHTSHVFLILIFTPNMHNKTLFWILKIHLWVTGQYCNWLIVEHMSNNQILLFFGNQFRIKFISVEISNAKSSSAVFPRNSAGWDLHCRGRHDGRVYKTYAKWKTN